MATEVYTFDLQEHMGTTRPAASVSQFVAGIDGIGKKERQKKLSCRPLFEICCLLLAEQTYVTEDVRRHQMEKLRRFVHGRLQEHKDYFKDSQIITSAFDFRTELS